MLFRSRYPLLDPAEEHQLSLDWHLNQDRKAAERLVTANLRLVVKLAFQYHRQWSNVLDLIQEGNVGLVEALRRFDPYRGIRFSSYAQYWIRAMILRFLMDNFRMVRLGSTRNGRKLFFQLQKEKERLVKEGLKPSTKLLAERLEVPESEVISVDQSNVKAAIIDSGYWPAADFSRVPYAVFVDPDVHRLEQERIFRGPVWNYAALEADRKSTRLNSSHRT